MQRLWTLSACIAVGFASAGLGGAFAGGTTTEDTT
jgi:hypothetical protein